MDGFEKWFYAQEGYGIRAERFDGEVAWLRAAYARGLEDAAVVAEEWGDPGASDVADIIRALAKMEDK